MIDPRAVTNFNRTDTELEEFMLFCIVVAGKGAFQQALKLEEFLNERHYNNYSPFYYIQDLDVKGKLVERLRLVRMGQYERVSTAFRGVSNFFYEDNTLRYADVKILECIKGIGMKTARFFKMHTWPGEEYACLDTHILQWLGERGHIVPKATPRGQQYLDLEKVFLTYCNAAGKSAAEMDLEIWNSRHIDVNIGSLQALTKV